MIWQVDLSLDCMFPGKGELRRNYGISDALVKADHTENVFVTFYLKKFLGRAVYLV